MEVIEETSLEPVTPKLSEREPVEAFFSLNQEESISCELGDLIPTFGTYS